MQELKKQISQIFIKWNLPTRQSAINEIMELFKAFGGCDKWVDENSLHDSDLPELIKHS